MDAGPADEAPGDAHQVHRDDDAGRYELRDGGDVLVTAAFEAVGPDVVAVTHTVTRPDRSGEGLGTRLVEGVLADLRRRGLRLRPDCPFVASYVSSHPQAQDLLAG